MTEIATVYATFGSEEEARRIARTLVEEGLAACANILAPCHSIYRWQGKIEEAGEVPALFKVAADRAQAAISRIAELHSYDIPAAVVWPIARTLEAYRDWVLDAVPEAATTPSPRLQEPKEPARACRPTD